MPALIASLPRWAWYGIAGVAAAIAFLLWLNAREEAAVERDRAKARVETVERAREADTAAVGQIEAVQTKVERRNVKAREAAANSDDPLKDALDALRAGR